MKTYIIAEAGVNHNGSIEMAKQLIDVAAESKVDAIKFQTFKAQNFITKQAAKAEYQKQAINVEESQFDMIKNLELSHHDHTVLIEYANSKNIEFLSTPFDEESLHLLTNCFNIKTIKVSSGDITNAPFLLDISRSANHVILSTGMSTLAEIEDALSVLAFGFLTSKHVHPHKEAFLKSFISPEGQIELKKRVSILHCTSEYPAPFNEVNLCAIDTILTAFGTRVGYSDHTKGIHIPIAAVAKGATIIEKHFTLDKNLPGPDHKASLNPQELNDMVRCIRDVEKSLGDGIKRPTFSEWKNRTIARKSLVLSQDTIQGEPMKLSCKRPGTGISPFSFWLLNEKISSKNYHADEILNE